jgi:hypothetical protein
MTTTIDREAIACAIALGIKPREAVKLLEMARREYLGDDVGELTARMMQMMGRKPIDLPGEGGMRPAVEKPAKAPPARGEPYWDEVDLSWTRQSVHDLDYGSPGMSPPVDPCQETLEGIAVATAAPRAKRKTAKPPKAPSMRDRLLVFMWRERFWIGMAGAFLAGLLIGRIL